MKAALIWSSVMIAAVLLIRSTLRAKLGSRLVYALWIPVVLRLMLPFALFTVTEVKETAAPEITAAAESVFNPAEEANERPSSDGAAPSANPILAVYLTGAGLTAGVFLLTNLSFARRLKRTRRRLDGERRLPVYVSGAADTPCLFGFFRPAVYLSENCADSNEVNLIFAHELAHFRHGDHIWSLVRCALVSLYWFDPLVWIAAVASRTDAELACDESVTERLSPKGRISYARTLLEFASGKKGYFSSAAGMGSGGGKLKERVKLIVKERKTAKITILRPSCMVKNHYFAREMAPKTPSDASSIMVPARRTPASTANVLFLKSILSILAARVPVQAPVPGSGIPTNRRSAI